MNLYARILVRHNRLAAACVICVTALAIVGAGFVQFEDEPGNVIERTGEEFERLQELNSNFGPDDNDLLLVIDGKELFTADSIRTLRKAIDQIAKVDGVESVFSIFDVRRRGSAFEWLIPAQLVASQNHSLHNDPLQNDPLKDVKDEALRHPIVRGHLLSEDGSTMVAVVRLAGGSLSVPYLSPRFQKLRQITSAATSTSMRLRWAGHQMARVDMSESIWREGPRLLLLGGAISAVIALALFRRFSACLIAIAGPFVGVALTLGTFGWTGIEVNALSTALPTLVFVIGFTDSVHLVLDLRAKQSAGLSKSEAIRLTMTEVGPACALTSLTTMIGFGSLTIADVTVVSQFGVDCAIGTFLSFVAVTTVIPLLAQTKLGDNLGKPFATTGSRPTLLVRMARTFSYGPWSRWLTSLLAVATCVVLGAVASKLRPDIQWMEMLSNQSETKQVWKHTDEKLGGTLLAYVVVEWPKDARFDMQTVKALHGIHKILNDEPTVQSPFSVVNLLLSFSKENSIRERDLNRLRLVPRLLRERLIRTDKSQTIVTAYVPDTGAAALMPGFARIEEQLQRLQQSHPKLNIQLTGTSVVAARNVHQIVDDLSKSLALASLVILVVMTIALRSLRLGLISVVPNAFPLLFAAAVLARSGEPLRLASAMTFSICLGIAVDDTIHFLTRFKQVRSTRADINRSLDSTVETVGVAMLVTSLTLIGGFAAMAISQLPSIQTFAQLASIAIVAALVADLLFLPALLACTSSRSSSRQGIRD